MKNWKSLLLLCTLFACGKSATNTTHNLTNADQSPSTVPEEVAALGATVFASTCAVCHSESATSPGPSPGLLGAMTPRSIVFAMANGKMREQSQALSTEEREAVAQWLTRTVLKDNALPGDALGPFTLDDPHDATFDQSGWGGNLEGTGFRSASQARIGLSNVGALELKWSFAFPGATQVRSKPALIGDWLIVGSQLGEVYAIHTKTGKPGWLFNADAAIRGAITVAQRDGGHVVYFADYSTNVYAVDATTGKLIWKTRSGFHPQSAVTGSVAVFDNRVFVPITSLEVVTATNPAYECCTSSGGVVALNASTGERLWTYKVIDEPVKVSGKKKNGGNFYGPSGAIVWCSPTVDAKRGRLYIGTGENYTFPATETSDAIQALDMTTGKLIWNFQATAGDTWNLACPGNPNCPDEEGPDLDFGSAPLLVRGPDGNDLLVAGQKSGVVHALTPEGKLLWQTRIGKGGALGGIHWGMAADEKHVYAAVADNAVAIDRRNKEISPSPGVYALDIGTGRVVWSVPTPPCDEGAAGCRVANSAAPTVIPGVVFAGALDGHIRAYSTRDGSILWDYNTVRDYATVNGVAGKGGALDGAAPVVANGMVFVNSGYDLFGQIPGNVLLAFGVPDEP